MKRLAIGLVATVAIQLPAIGHAENYATVIADGKPWQAKLPDGPNLRLTLNPDGTGKMAVAIMSQAIAWRSVGDTICLEGMPQGKGPGCITFRPVDGGFEGQGSDGQNLTLLR